MVNLNTKDNGSKESVREKINALKRLVNVLGGIKARVNDSWVHRDFVEAVQIVNPGMQKIIDDYEQEGAEFDQVDAQLEDFIDKHINQYHVIAQKVDLPVIMKKLSNRARLLSIENDLAKLSLKINEYKKHPGIEEYESASKAANNIYIGLNTLLNEKKSQQLNLKEFKAQAIAFLNSDNVKEDIKTLETPRGLKVKTIVSNIMIALATLIVGYPLYLLINKGFFKPSTDGANVVDALNKTHLGLEIL